MVISPRRPEYIVSDGPWIDFRSSQKECRMRLFCFPYAGGGAWFYRNWQAQLPARVEVCPIELPGRGRRVAETPFRSLTLAANAISEAIAPYARNAPCAVFGHSMGALLAFEVGSRLESDIGANLRAAFLSGARGPGRRREDPREYEFPRDQFIELLRSWNATPEVLLNDSDVMDLLLPCIRADLELAQTYRFDLQNRRLRCMTLAFGGREDAEVEEADLQAWANATSGPFSLHMFPGDHFYLAQRTAELTGILSRYL